MNDKHEKLVYAEQVKAVYSHTFTAVVSNPLAAILLTSIFYKVVDDGVLFVWLACVILLSLTRIYPYIIFLKQAHDEDSIRYWGKVFLFTSFLQGSLWGIGWLFLIPTGNPLHVVVIGTWIIGLSASAVGAYSGYIKALLAFFIPVMLPGIAQLLIIGEGYGTAVGLGIILYSAVVIRSVVPVNKSMLNAIRLNFELEEEINKRKKTENKLRELSIKDGLTGIFNRRHFDQVLETDLRSALRISKPISLILIDIDYFKAYNDRYGHLDGDICLQKVAKAVKESANRPNDLAFRYGGEEFAVILPSTDLDGAIVMAKTIQKNVQKLNIPHEESTIDNIHLVTVSSGVATLIPESGTTPSDIIQQADDALYQAKSDGRNRVVIFSD